MGRYYLYLEAIEKGVDITIDEAKSSKIAELIERIEGDSEPTPMPSITPLKSAEPSPTPVPTPTASEMIPSNSPIISKSPEVSPGLSAKEITTFSESVVSVTVFDQNKSIISQGSGFCVGTGLFVTNYRLVEDGVVINITEKDGKVYNVDGIVKYDKARDLVVLKTTVDTGMKPLKIGSKASLAKGDWIVAIGKSKGLTNTVSEGSIKAFKTDKIELTAPISSESSGGPVLDRKGNVVGITSYGISNKNVNSAIPADYIVDWVKELARNNIKVIRKTLAFDSEFELNFVVYKIIRALENEDINAYFNCMIDELYTNETKDNLEVLFSKFDLAYNIESIKVTSKNEEQAKVSYVYTISKESGPEFKNYRITGECSLVRVNGVWKISDSTENKEYI